MGRKRKKSSLGLAVTVCAGLCNVALDALFIIGFNVQLLKYAGEDGVVIYGLLMYVSLIFPPSL